MKEKQNNRNLVSVIIPCYKQEKTIERDLIYIRDVMEQLRYDYEIIVVVDGAVDATLENAKKVKSAKIKVTGYKHNHGKGFAIRFGMLHSKGDIVGFIDSGMDLNPNGISMLLEHFEWYKADIVVGSKWHPVSKVVYPFWRKILSLSYGSFVKILFGLKVSDTQLGLKLFRKEVLEKVLPRLLVKKYAIDIELLAVADRLGFKRIYEAPIELNWKDLNSNISKNLLNSIWNMMIDTMAVFYRLKITRYYDDSAKRKWRYDSELKLKVNLP